jgi:hypothetical protein
MSSTVYLIWRSKVLALVSCWMKTVLLPDDAIALADAAIPEFLGVLCHRGRLTRFVGLCFKRRLARPAKLPLV